MQLNFDNRGGIRRVYAIPVTDILRIRHNWTSRTVTPELRRRDGIVELPTYAGQDYAFTEERVLTDHGTRDNVSLKGRIPARLIQPSTIQKLSDGEWLVLHQDTCGRIRLSGTALVPLRFVSTSDSGQTAPELNGETFTFSAVESITSPECYIADINQL